MAIPSPPIVPSIKTSAKPADTVEGKASPTERCCQRYHQDLSGICQTFEISELTEGEISPTQTQSQLDQPLWVPIPSDSVISRTSSAIDLSSLMEGAMDVEDRRAPIERLPAEMFDQIMQYLAISTHTNSYTTRNKDLASCLLVSRTFHYHTLATLYSHVTFPHSSIFSKFLSHIQRYPELGDLVRRLDFSVFTSVGLGRTMRMNFEIQKLTASTLRACLSLSSRLREFLASESMGMDMDVGVLRKLFCELPYLQALDFCGLAHPEFVEGMAKVLTSTNYMLPERMPIKRLGLHGCTTVHMASLSTLLPRLPFLTHLDLTHTQVTDAMLQTIPHTANLTHLSLSRCNRLKGFAVVDFLLEHPACKNLEFLNLLFETSRYRLLSITDVDRLLSNLPASLVSLNLSGAKIISDHVPQLRALAKQLEELSVGFADLTLHDVCTILEPGYGNEDPGCKNLSRHTIKYLDLTGIASITPQAILYTSSCPILHPSSYPLQVLELSEKIITGLGNQLISGKKVGWKVQDQGRRGWYVRAESGIYPGGEEVAKKSLSDDGGRTWKMGGKWWGNRKIGCAFGEISGIYGYYGFGH
ncbi:hypothetical protein DFH27DRAFT_249228 [Peziza echinospora]|nr:hypothetical protein DFH27DRAFT_249228 [Peziza echinospora]